MIKKENGNYVYTGFCIDLLEKISKICNFTYKIRLVEDGYHGSWNGSKWNGMIGEITEKVFIKLTLLLFLNYNL